MDVPVSNGVFVEMANVTNPIVRFIFIFRRLNQSLFASATQSSHQHVFIILDMLEISYRCIPAERLQLSSIDSVCAYRNTFYSVFDVSYIVIIIIIVAAAVP